MDTKGKESVAPELNWRNKPRRSFTPEQRLAIVGQTQMRGVSVAEVAQRNHINTNLLFKWKRLHEAGLLPAPKESAALVPVTVVKTKRRRVRTAKVTKPRAKAAPASGTIEIEVPGARIYLHGAVSESDLASTLRALARK
jgi:transposase-like protein